MRRAVVAVIGAFALFSVVLVPGAQAHGDTNITSLVEGEVVFEDPGIPYLPLDGYTNVGYSFEEILIPVNGTYEGQAVSADYGCPASGKASNPDGLPPGQFNGSFQCTKKNGIGPNQLFGSWPMPAEGELPTGQKGGFGLSAAIIFFADIDNVSKTNSSWNPHDLVCTGRVDATEFSADATRVKKANVALVCNFR